MQNKIKVAIVGPGNIGIDLMEKIRKRAKNLELALVVGIDENSDGIRRAKEYGVQTSVNGLEPLLDNAEIRIVFEATSAAQHLKNAPYYAAAGKVAFDLTPAAVGPYVVPAVNFAQHAKAKNINLVTCGGQATTPIVYAVSRIQEVDYAEIVSTLSSKSAGPGTRANIDEFTQTTARALCEVGGAKHGKALIILNPATPPLMMRNTIYCRTSQSPDMPRITASVEKIVKDIQ
ncbi:MAG: acetaldehyde dehydrogenase (acetylating), partial [Ruthenibacterium sp.]